MQKLNLKKEVKKIKMKKNTHTEFAEYLFIMIMVVVYLKKFEFQA